MNVVCCQSMPQNKEFRLVTPTEEGSHQDTCYCLKFFVLSLLCPLKLWQQKHPSQRVQNLKALTNFLFLLRCQCSCSGCTSGLICNSGATCFQESFKNYEGISSEFCLLANSVLKWTVEACNPLHRRGVSPGHIYYHPGSQNIIMSLLFMIAKCECEIGWRFFCGLFDTVADKQVPSIPLNKLKETCVIIPNRGRRRSCRELEEMTKNCKTQQIYFCISTRLFTWRILPLVPFFRVFTTASSPNGLWCIDIFFFIQWNWWAGLKRGFQQIWHFWRMFGPEKREKSSRKLRNVVYAILR